MAFMDFPVIEGRTPSMQCVFESSVRQNVPANILLGILELEGGKNGTVRVNDNGSLDLGVAQINTIHLEELKSQGINTSSVAYFLKYDGCYSIEFAAHLLKKRLTEGSGSIWQRAAAYHSKTPKFNQIYQAKLRPAATRWADYLSRNYVTKEYTQ